MLRLATWIADVERASRSDYRNNEIREHRQVAGSNIWKCMKKNRIRWPSIQGPYTITLGKPLSCAQAPCAARYSHVPPLFKGGPFVAHHLASQFLATIRWFDSSLFYLLASRIVYISGKSEYFLRTQRKYPAVCPCCRLRMSPRTWRWRLFAGIYGKLLRCVTTTLHTNKWRGTLIVWQANIKATSSRFRIVHG